MEATGKSNPTIHRKAGSQKRLHNPAVLAPPTPLYAETMERSRPEAARVTVIIPALNEADAIGAVVRELPWNEIDECVVVDNGSTDATAAVAQAAGARVITSPRGYGNACLAGSLAAAPTSEILVYCDGDGADITDDLHRLVRPIALGAYDFVIGSRIRGHREAGSMLGSQVFAAHLVGTLLRFFPSVRRHTVYTDMGAFRAIRRSSFAQLDMQERTFGWNLEMQLRAAQIDLRILEIPVNYRRRAGGVSKVSGDLRASVRAATRILGVLFRVGLRGRQRLPAVSSNRAPQH